MLRTEALQVKYGDFTAVSSASLEVPEGSIAALIGANGAGKTSLLQAAAGLIRPSGGHLYFGGEEITGLSAPERVRRGLSLVPQGGRCFLRMSVEDNLLMGAYLQPARREAGRSLTYVYDLFPDLADRRKMAAGALSGGQRQMVAIGRALMARPRCLMFDEISLGLAPIVIQEIYRRIRQINETRKTTIVLVEQDTARAMQISDVCFVMLKGTITLSGPSAELTPGDVRLHYFGLQE